MSGKEELNAITRNTYCVNEKIPPTYARKWKLYVLHLDGTSETFFGDDSDGGYADVYRRALASAERKQVPPSVAPVPGNRPTMLSACPASASTANKS